jgi:hypothetical protein
MTQTRLRDEQFLARVVALALRFARANLTGGTERTRGAVWLYAKVESIPLRS